MALDLNSSVVMRRLALAVLVAFAACRGEKVPRDYQNNPMTTNAVTSKEESPSAHGMPGPGAEPSTGVEGKTTLPVNPPSDAAKNPVPNTTTLPPNAVTSTAANSTIPEPPKKP